MGKKQGIGYRTAWNWFKSNKLLVDAYQTPSGAILVNENSSVNENRDVFIYCRVSSYEKKEDLKRQVVRCEEFCNSKGWIIKKVFKEIASDMNDKRPKLLQMLNDNSARIVVEHKDRLTRFGFNYFEQLLPRLNCEPPNAKEFESNISKIMNRRLHEKTHFYLRSGNQ